MTTRNDEGEKLRREIGRRESVRGPLRRDVRERSKRYAAARSAAGGSYEIIATELGVVIDERSSLVAREVERGGDQRNGPGACRERENASRIVLATRRDDAARSPRRRARSRCALHGHREARVIGLGRRVPVFAFAEVVDMRKSFDTLGAIVREHMKHDILDGALFVFVGRDRRRAKVLFWDGTGLCVLARVSRRSGSPRLGSGRRRAWSSGRRASSRSSSKAASSSGACRSVLPRGSRASDA